MQIPSTSLGVAFDIIVTAFFAILSYLLDRPIRGHRLTIGQLKLSSAHNIRYEGALVGDKHEPYLFVFIASSITWAFYWPRSPNPRWCTLICESMYYTSSTCDVSAARIEAVFWFFPVLYKQTAGPWCDATVDGVRAMVFKSSETPYFVQRLRASLVETVLTGNITRADMIRTSVKFSGRTEHPEHKPTEFSDSTHKLSADDPDTRDHGDDTLTEEFRPDEDVPGSDSDSDTLQAEEEEDISGEDTKPLRAYDAEEVAFCMLARQLMISGEEGRMYSFGSVDAQVRRDWASDKGSLMLVAEECRYVRVLFPFEHVAPRSWWSQLCSSLFRFPIDLVHTFIHPVSCMNLYVVSLDVTFEAFRLRDAELLKQGVALVHEKSMTSRIDWSDVFMDFFTGALASH